MENQRLAEASTIILGAYLPYLWHDNLPAEADPAQAAVARGIWQVIRPLLDVNATLDDVCIEATSTPTAGNLAILREELNKELADDPQLALALSSFLEAEAFKPLVDSLSGDVPPEQLQAIADKVRWTIAKANEARRVTSEGVSVKTPISNELPACQACGRQDETLRLVSYPFVFSLAVVTFRRRFAGLWCRRHALQRQILAMLITMCFGWLGFPFGFIFTPAALSKLVVGGERPVMENQRLLYQLAAHRKKTGDILGAVRCLESALRYGPSPIIENELRSLNDRYAPDPFVKTPRRVPQVVVFGGVLLAAGLLGLTVGVFDYLIDVYVMRNLKMGGFLGMFLYWVPLVVMILGSVTLLSQLYKAAITWAPTRNKLLGGTFAIVVALVTIYNIPTGASLMDFFIYNDLSYAFSSPFIFLQDLAWTFTQGAVSMIQFNLTDEGATLYPILLLAGMGFFSWINLRFNNEAHDWLRQLEETRSTVELPRQRVSSAGWLSIIIPTLVFVGAAAWSWVPLGDQEVFNLVNEGFAQIEAGDWDGARDSFDTALSLSPELPHPYLGQMALAMSIGDCSSVLEYIDDMPEATPDEYLSYVYSFKADAYRCLGQPEAALEVYQQTLDAQLVDETALYVGMGMAYWDMGDLTSAKALFEQATESEPDDAANYALTALMAYLLGEPDEEARMIEQALELPLDDPGDLLDIGMYYSYKHDYEQAVAYGEQAQALASVSPLISLSLASIQIHSGQYDAAQANIDRAFEANPNWTEAYVMRSILAVEQGDMKLARSACNTALAFEPESLSAYEQLSYIDYFDNDREAAVNSANHALEISPYSAMAYRILALAYLDEGDFDAAQQAAEHAVVLSPVNDLAHYVLGMVYLEKGQDEMAARELQAFLDLTWDRAFVQDFRANAEAVLNEIGE